MNNLKRRQTGFSIVELMIGASIGLILGYGILRVYLAQSQIYKVSNSQQLTQSSINAVTNLVSPVLRSAGFAGCGTINSAVSNLNAGGPNPVGSLNTLPTFIMGYSGGVSAITLQVNPANGTSAGSWTPALDASLVGSVQTGSDVVVVLGSTPGALPISVTAGTAGSTSMSIQGANGLSFTSGQLGAVSDCVKTLIFAITGSSGTSIIHNGGGGAMQNSSGNFTVNFQPGAQFIPMQQTAFFVGQGTGGQSALMRAVLTGTTWDVQPIVPGVEIMKVLYGTGANGVVTNYVPANSVTNWSQVYAVRIGFLIAGQKGSGTGSTTAFQVLDTSVTPASTDDRLRHVFEITINLRNAL